MSGMDDLRDTLMAYGCIAVRAQDPASLYTFVDQECGTKLHLAWPDNGYIQLRPRTLMGPFSSKYYDVCCQGEDCWLGRVGGVKGDNGKLTVLFCYQESTCAATNSWSRLEWWSFRS